MRTHELLYEDEHCNIFRICWPSGYGLDFHDHGESYATITVVEGALSNTTIDDDYYGEAGSEFMVAGETFNVLPFQRHKVVNDWDEPAVSIHVYIPPLTSLYDDELEIIG